MTITTGEERTDAQGRRGGIPADTFANRLMLARAFAGHLSINEAADRCKGFGVRIGRGAWANWEKGAQPFDKLTVVEIISEQLGVDADWLLNGGPLVQQKRRTRWRREEEPTVAKRPYSPLAGISRPPGHPKPADRLVRTGPARPLTSRSAA